MNTATSAAIRAPRGSQLTCRTWAAESAYRMIQNNLDAEVAERPEDWSSMAVWGVPPGTGIATVRFSEPAAAGPR